jgi:hypothetical protein
VGEDHQRAASILSTGTPPPLNTAELKSRQIPGFPEADFASEFATPAEFASPFEVAAEFHRQAGSRAA